MPLDKKQGVLIVCRALNPFVTFDLLTKTPAGEVQPIPEAEGVGIKDLFTTLDMQDKKFGQHVVDFILNSIFEQCRDARFSVSLGKGELVTGVFATIGELADNLSDTSKALA